MIYLASSSPSRAQILKARGVEFEQIAFNYDESVIHASSPLAYPASVVELKARQFLAHYGRRYDRVLFADSSVIARGRVLGKAHDASQARAMLALQSGARASVASAMKFVSADFCLDALSVATFSFASFDEAHLNDYIASDLWRGKAGAMMIEGFNGRYITHQSGSTATAMGLDIDTLLSFL